MAIFKMLHWSDSHADGVATTAAKRMIAGLDVDAVLHTGDIVSNKFSDPINYIKPLNFMVTIGNHDDITDEGAAANPMDWTKQPTQQQLYEKFIEPTIQYTGIEVDENTTWWVKDFADPFFITIIGVNTSVRGQDLVKQQLWLIQKLEWCRQNNRKIIIACHYPPSEPAVVYNSWTAPELFRRFGNHADTENVEGELYPALPAIYDEVCDYCDSGGDVIAWLCGHEHPDAFFIAGNERKFPMVCVGSTVRETQDADHWWANNVNRDNDSNSDKCAVLNLYEYDTVLNEFTIKRVGANVCTFGYLRDSLVFRYKTGTVTSILARA